MFVVLSVVDINRETRSRDTEERTLCLKLVQEPRYTRTLKMLLKPAIIIPNNHAARSQQRKSVFSVGTDAFIGMISVDEHQIDAVLVRCVVERQRVAVKLMDLRAVSRVAKRRTDLFSRLEIESQNFSLVSRINRHFQRGGSRIGADFKDATWFDVAANGCER